MAVTESQGTVFAYSTDSGTTYNTVAQVTNISGLGGGSATVIDITNLASTRREKRMGLPDEGQITLELNYDPDDTGHSALETLRDGRTLADFKITATDTTPTEYTFQGYVTVFNKDFQIDDVAKGTLTIEITGAVTKT